MASPSATLHTLDSLAATALEPQPVAQPQPDAQPLDATTNLTEPLRQLLPGAARDGESGPALVQSPPPGGTLRVPSMEKLPAMPEETPDKRKQREKEEIERKRREQESLEFQQRFDLSPTEPLVEDYSCAHTATGAIYQGRLYLSKSYMCFYSPLFSKLLRVNLRKLIEVEKRSTLGVFPNGIEVTTENGKKLSFISFIYRDQAYNTLTRLVKEIKELGAPPPTPHSDELPNIVAPEEEDPNKPRAGSAVRRTLSRSLSTGNAAGIRSSSPLPVEERRLSGQLSDSGLRHTNGGDDSALSAASAQVAASAAAVTPTPPVAAPTPTPTPTPTPATEVPKPAAPAVAATFKEPSPKESATPAKRAEEPKGGKETIAALLSSNGSNGSTLKIVAPTPIPLASLASSSTLETNGGASAVAPPVVAAAPVATVEPLAAVPVTDKCTHLTPCKSAPVLTQTVSLSIAAFFRRVMADGTNTWMLALKDPNADSYFTQGPWSLSKEKCCLQRKLEFQVPYQSPIRSAITRVVQEHTIRQVKPDYVVFESSSQSLDVPYSDSFSVITRMDIEATTADSCHIALRTEVKWLKTVWMLKSTIESKSIEGNTQFLTHWLDVVKRKATEIETPEPARTKEELKIVDTKPVSREEASVAPAPAPAPQVAAALPPVSPSSLRASSSTLSMQQAPSGFQSPFSLSTVLIGIGLLLLLLVFLFLRVSSTEAQLSSLRGANARLERRLVFLQSFVSALSENVTGSPGALKEQLAHWQAFEAFRRQLEQGRDLARTAASLMERVLQQQAEHELALSRAVAEQAAHSSDYTAVVFADAAESSASWGASLVALLITVILVFVADLYLLSGAVTYRILRRPASNSAPASSS